MVFGRGYCPADSLRPVFLCSFSEVILYIFRFPVGERESVCVDDGAIDNDAISFWSAHWVLWDKRGVYLLCTGVQKSFKRRTDRAFAYDVVLCVLL